MIHDVHPPWHKLITHNAFVVNGIPCKSRTPVFQSSRTWFDLIAREIVFINVTYCGSPVQTACVDHSIETNNQQSSGSSPNGDERESRGEEQLNDANL